VFAIQAARIQELHDEIESKLPPGYSTSVEAGGAGGEGVAAEAGGDDMDDD